MNPTLVVTKYTLPPARSREISRERLLQSLLAGLAAKLTLISAPAGFGKSTLAADLARRAGRKAAWLSLDRADNDPVRWGAYLAAAVRQSGFPLSGQVAPPERFDGPSSLESQVVTLINEVATDGSPLLLLMDDYHLIQAGEIHDAVALLLDRLPPNLHVVIATRSRPPLPLARLRVRGELAEVTARDLRFTPEEAEAFLHRAMGLDLPADGVASLMDRTEGWVAGLQLAALSLHGSADWKTAMDEFGGSSPDVLAYLVDEVVDQQPEPIQRFLLQTAVLDRLTGPLCDAVTGQPDGQRTLAALEQANLFLFPLDPERRWYRYHPLFAEFLLARLQSETAESGVADLRCRAARWLYADGQFTEAVDQLLSAGALEQAADWLETAFADGSAGSSLPVGRWVGQLSEAVVTARPRLATMAAWVLIAGGEGLSGGLFTRASAYLDTAACLLKQAEAAGENVRESLGILAAVRTALAPWAPVRQCPMCTMQDVAHAVQVGEEARRLLPEESPFWRSVVAGSLGSVYLRAGNVAEAAREFGDAARFGVEGGSLAAAVTALQRYARALTALGRLGEADGAYREALRLATRQGGEALPLLAPVYLGMGLVQYERNEPTAATESLAEALKRFEAGGATAPEALLAMARVRQTQGESDSARDLVERAGDLLGGGRRLRAASAEAWPDGVRVLLALGDVAAARRWAQARRAGMDPEPDLWRAAEYIVLARLLIAEGRAEAALPTLRALRQAAAAGGCRAVEAEAWLTEALALDAVGDSPGAGGAVEAALALTADESFVRLFADAGPPVVALLRRIAGDTTQGDALPRRFHAERILSLLGLISAPPPSEAPPAPPGIEPLTEREQEIVRLLALGYSNQEIAGTLYMGVSTVKWHLLNIYGKLQVKSRTQAAARARSLGLA